MLVTAPIGQSRALAETAEVAELYERNAGQVRRQVRSGVTACDAVIDDACQFAWSRLVHRRDRIRGDSVVPWLVTTAVHEAFKLIRRDSRDLSLEILIEQPEDVAGARPETDHALSLPISATVRSPEWIVEQRLQLEALGRLPERQRRLLWLQGLGFSYAEMADRTGDTERTVERQLIRARRKLGTPSAPGRACAAGAPPD
jgi:RNA polymerase sigma factor (sigma-70 family)